MWRFTKMSHAGIVFCDFTVPAVLRSRCMRGDFWLRLWGLRVHVGDAGGSRVKEDKRCIVERLVHSWLDLANVIQDSPRLSLTFGFLFSQGCGSPTEECKTNMDTLWGSLQLNIHLAATSKWNLSEQHHHLYRHTHSSVVKDYYYITAAWVRAFTLTDLHLQVTLGRTQKVQRYLKNASCVIMSCFPK